MEHTQLIHSKSSNDLMSFCLSPKVLGFVSIQIDMTNNISSTNHKESRQLSPVGNFITMNSKTRVYDRSC